MTRTGSFVDGAAFAMVVTAAFLFRNAVVIVALGAFALIAFAGS
jgi:hypothetical protein